MALCIQGGKQLDATVSGQPETFASVTHPGHPLYKQKLKVLSIRRCKSVPRLVYLAKDGTTSTIRLSWTDYEGVPQGKPPLDSDYLLDIRGLLEVVKIVAHLKQGTDSASADEGTRRDQL